MPASNRPMVDLPAPDGPTMARRSPGRRLTMPKWAWALLCLIQFVGPIVFFVAGRTPAPMADASVPDPRTTPDRVIDSLYGRDQ